jgi:hypothetical protein
MSLPLRTRKKSTRLGWLSKTASSMSHLGPQGVDLWVGAQGGHPCVDLGPSLVLVGLSHHDGWVVGLLSLRSLLSVVQNAFLNLNRVRLDQMNNRLVKFK